MNIGLFHLTYMILILNIKFPILTLHNKMVMLKGKIDMLLKWVSHILLIIMFLSFYPSAFQTSIILINYLLTHVLSNNTPYKLLYKKKTKISFFKTLNCLCCPFLRPYN